MNWTTKFNGSNWSLLYAVTCLTIFAVVLWFGASTNTVQAGADKASPEGGISGTGTGAIPDGGPGCGPGGTPLEVMFDGSGLSGTISDVSIDVDIAHTWVGDVQATLVAPSGEEHILFSDTQSTTATGCGDSSDLGFLYTFNDAAAGDWWAEALNGTGAYVMAAGAYRTSTAGDVPGGGATTDMNPTFAAANPTGDWTLRVIDAGGGDIGGVNTATLNVTTAGGPMGNPNPDFDGDDKTDYSIVRDVTPPPAGPIPGTGTGGIPDGGPGCGPFGAPLEVSFDGSGLSGTISNVSVDMDIAHTWVGDVRATLVAPSGEEHLLFSDTQSTTATGCGDSSDLGGIYAFNDAAGGDWWAESLNGTGAYVMAAGDYRTSTAGDVPGGGVATDMNVAFAGANPTGTWTLRFEDGGGGDVGTVTAANLTVSTSAASLASNARRSIQELQRDPGFKPLQPTGGNNLGATPGTGLGWYVSNSGTGTFNISDFGNPATDFWVPSDYDGDGQDDIAVWRGVAPAGPAGGYFHSFNSSTSTVMTVDFGQQGDNPTVVGDYDGDDIADPAVYRCPSGGGQCTFFYKGSAGGGDITYFDWGNNSSTFIRPYPGDFDGDGQNDFCIFQDSTYTLFRSSDSGVEYISWGLPTDPVIAPGDYDGDGQTDFMNVRVNGVDVEWWLLERDGAQSTTVWGALVPGFAEFATPGDFDGDGSTDIVIWRRDNSSNSNSFFYTLRSSDGMLEAFEWGSMGDAPVPGWNSN